MEGMRTPQEILNHYWGYDSFREPQLEIIQSVMRGQDTLALLPTGAGKSICYQVPGMMQQGLTLVISPLLALMRDQVDALNRRGIAATAVNSMMGHREIDRKLREASENKYKFLYLAPERLRSHLFLDWLPRIQTSLLAVDEAHCISQWGYDFRPAYLEIAAIRPLLPQVPVIALTASATPRVQEDIASQLKLKNPQKFIKSFRRPNLAFRVEQTENIPGRIAQLVDPGKLTAIVYARTRRKTEQFAGALIKMNYAAAAFHGGLKPQQREVLLTDWMEGRTPTMVATNAFGMGIDKADVRQVLHLNLPADPESYYQEAGRAGRDGFPAIAWSFWNEKEVSDLRKWVEEKYPSFEFITQSLDCLWNWFRIPDGAQPDEIFAVDLGEIAKKADLSPILFYNALRILHNEGILALDETPETWGHIRFITAPAMVLKYKEDHPSHSSLTDFILRNLGGEAWHEEVGFNPVRWMKKLQFTQEELNKQLDQLVARGLITYRPPSLLPGLRMLIPHRRLLKAEINWDKYKFLKAQAIVRLEAFLAWVKAEGISCRAQGLEFYFGEQNETPCGICDLCIARKHKKSDIKQLVREQILELLAQGKKSMSALLNALDHGTKEQKQEIIRDLLDRGEIMNQMGMLELARRK